MLLPNLPQNETVQHIVTAPFALCQIDQYCKGVFLKPCVSPKYKCCKILRLRTKNFVVHVMYICDAISCKNFSTVFYVRNWPYFRKVAARNL